MTTLMREQSLIETGPDRWMSSLASGPESESIMQRIQECLHHQGLTASSQRETVEERFDRLSRQWKRKSEFLSSISQMAMLPEYQQIIGMGSEVLSYILESLRREPDHWFWALNAITGVNPIRDEDRGHIQRMTEAWIEWGIREGYLI